MLGHFQMQRLVFAHDAALMSHDTSHDWCRQGAQFNEVWVDGSKYKQLSESQERLGAQREELERQRKSLSKRRPPSGGTAAGGRSSSPAQPGKTGFVKPQPARLLSSLPSSNHT